MPRRTLTSVTLPCGRDRALEDHDALHAGLLRDVGVDRGDVLELLRLLDLAADAHRLDRGRRRVGQAADDAADDAAGHAALDAARDAALDAEVDALLGLDLLGNLDGGDELGVLHDRLGHGLGRVGRPAARAAAAAAAAAGAAMGSTKNAFTAEVGSGSWSAEAAGR